MKYLSPYKLFESGVSDIWYHGSDKKFAEFSTGNNKTYQEFDVYSWFFTQDIDYTERYGKYLYAVELSISKTFDTRIKKHMNIFLDQLKDWGISKDKTEEILEEQFYKGLPYWTCGDAFYTAKAHGFDSIFIEEELEDEVISVAVFNLDDIKIIDVTER